MQAPSELNLPEVVPGYHACAIYRSEKEHRQVLVPFITEGLRKGEKVICATYTVPETTIHQYLVEAGVDPAPYLASGQLSILTTGSAYLPGGAFSPTQALERIEKLVISGPAEGYSGVRITGDVCWLAELPEAREAFFEYEASVNRILREHGGAAICQYDRRRFDTGDLLRCLATHPVAFVHGDVFPNPHYLDPAEVQKEPDVLELHLRQHREALSRVESRSTERRLQESEARFGAMAESMADALLTIDAESRIQYANPAAHQILAYGPGNLVGRPITEIIPPEYRARHRAGFQRHLDTGERTVDWARLKFPVLRSDGTRFDAEVSFGRHHAEGQVRFTGVIRDVTESKEAAARLMQAQKMEAVGRLAGGVAHDFSNLLTVFRGNAELALSELSDTEGVKEALNEILREVERAEEITRQLLTFSRQETPRNEVLDLGAVVEEMQPLLTRLTPSRIELRFAQTEGERRRVWGSRGHLHQIVLNLVVNAVDAIPGAGVITIQIEPHELPPSGSPSQGHPGPGAAPEIEEGVRLSVSDTGSGIAPEIRDKILEPFFTTKPRGEGTGLGLSTVFGIVQDWGGEIEVESEEGAGTTCHVILPGTRGDPETLDQVSLPDQPRRQGWGTIVVADDSAPLRGVAQRILTRAGYRVLVAENGEEALELLRNADEEVVLLLTDLVMPRMGGAQLLQTVQAEGIRIPMVLMSGHGEKETAHFQETDQTHFLAKPFTPAQLLNLVHRLLGEPGAGA